MVFNLPFLGAVHMEEVGVLIWLALMCCALIGIIGHILGCSDPTAPTQNPLCPRKQNHSQDDDSEDKVAGEEDEEAEPINPSDDKKRLLKKHDNLKRNLTKSFDEDGKEKRFSLKLDPQKQSFEANSWAEKRKAQIAKANELRNPSSPPLIQKKPSSRNQKSKDIELTDIGSPV